MSPLTGGDESGRVTSSWCTETMVPLKAEETILGCTSDKKSACGYRRFADVCGLKDRSCSVEESNRSQYKDNDEASVEAGTSSEASTQDNNDEIASASGVGNKISSKCTDNCDNNDEIASASGVCNKISSKCTDIQDDYTGGEGSTTDNSQQFSTARPAHELRAIAASISLHRGKPYAEVIKAVGWSSASTFGRFYMRHLGISEALSQQPLPLP